MPRNPNCTRCELHKGARNVCIWGDGPSDAMVVAIGEAPGEAEAKTARPFMGRSGKLLREELKKAGLNDVYITNIVKCRPPDNRDPTPDEIKACRPYLEEELSTVKSKYVLTLGKPATKEVLGQSKITQIQGQILPSPKKWPRKFQGVPAFHPAYVLRDPSKLPDFRKALERLKRDIDGEVWDSTVEWELVTARSVRRFVDEFLAVDEFSFDLETSSLNWFKPETTITSINIGLNDKAWIIPIHMQKSPYLGRREAQLRLGELLMILSKGKLGIAHNGKFDNHWLWAKLGVRFDLRFDTMLAHHVIDENTPHDLEYLAHYYLEAPRYDIPLREKQWPTDLPRFWDYTGKDAVYTLRLKQIFDRELKKQPDLRRLFYKLQMRASRALGGSIELPGIEEYGMTLDVPKFNQTGIEIAAERDTLEHQLNDAVRDLRRDHRGIHKTTNWNSPQQVAKVLFKEAKIRPAVYTPKGAPSTSEESLIALKGKHPVVDALLKYRECAKFYSTYIEGFRELMVDDKLYISYKIHGTVTGRYSSRLHSVPRDGKIRNLAIAPDGWEFLQGDFSQAELRIAAELSGDLELRRCFAPGGPDVHWSTLLHTIESGSSNTYFQPTLDTARTIAESTASRIRNIRLPQAIEILREAGHEACIEIWKGWKEARKRGKAINFGFLYGMFENKFIETCKMKYGFEPTFAEATEFKRAYFALYRGLHPWHEKQKKLVALDGFVRSLSGRIRRLPGIASSDRMLRSECERQAINSPVQGVIGDIKAMAMVEIHETLPHTDLRLVGEHHDAILGIVRKGPTMIPTLRRMKSIMERPSLFDDFMINLSIPLVAEIEIGPWGAGRTVDLS